MLKGSASIPSWTSSQLPLGNKNAIQVSISLNNSQFFYCTKELLLVTAKLLLSWGIGRINWVQEEEKRQRCVHFLFLLLLFFPSFLYNTWLRSSVVVDRELSEFTDINYCSEFKLQCNVLVNPQQITAFTYNSFY